MDDFHSDILIQIISFLNVMDSGVLTCTSKRFSYLVHHYRTWSGPKLVVAKGRNSDLSSDTHVPLVESCVKRLTSPPTFAIAFHASSSSSNLTQASESILQTLPPNTVCVGAFSYAIQAHVETDLDCDFDDALMLGSFLPERTHIEPFRIRMDSDTETFEEQASRVKTKLRQCSKELKVMIVFPCGDGNGHAEHFITSLQALYPAATIVGGICDCAYSQSGVVANGIVGMAFAGDVPVRSVVSRGVKSLVEEGTGEKSPWRVHESRLLKPTDDEYMFAGPSELLRPYHEIRLLRNTDSGQIKSPMHLLARMPAHFVGLQRPSEDGFRLTQLDSISRRTNRIIVAATENGGADGQEVSSYKDARVDFFELEGEACLHDMDRTLTMLKEQIQVKNEVILGGLMFSCSGRGPEPGLLREPMADAQRFHNHFPQVPCLGFYAGGEIGPQALVGKKDVFQKGSAALQGFTAVFALFIVPVVVEPGFHIDDCDQNVAHFIAGRLGRR